MNTDLTLQTDQQLERQRDQIIQDLKEIDREIHRRATLPPPNALAESLHRIQCKRDHTDKCEWYYEIQNGRIKWDARAHAYYLEKADRLLHEFGGDSEKVLKIVELVS